jgi:hypothetical protein
MARDAAQEVHGEVFDPGKVLFDSFKSIYSAVRLYHGTRVDDPGRFWSSGILLSDIHKLKQRTFELFGTNEIVSRAMRETDVEEYAEYNTGKIFVCLDPCQCLYGHYYRRGSEYVQAIARRINRLEVIEATGTSTLVSFDIAIGKLSENDLNSIARNAIGSIYRNWRRPGNIKRVLECSFSISEPVLPIQIREVIPAILPTH